MRETESGQRVDEATPVLVTETAKKEIAPQRRVEQVHKVQGRYAPGFETDQHGHDLTPQDFDGASPDEGADQS